MKNKKTDSTDFNLGSMIKHFPGLVFTTATSVLADKVTTSINTTTIKLGVTGLSRSGKTVFISALVHNLMNGGSLPLFEKELGKIKQIKVEPRTKEDIARFDYESNISKILEDREWPESTKQISEIRLVFDFKSNSRLSSNGRLNLDIVDYPGEWLLDLPLLNKSYTEWCQDALEAQNHQSRSGLGKSWKSILGEVNPNDNYNPAISQQLLTEFMNYLKECKDDPRAIYKLPPGRFHEPPVDWVGKAAMIFTPLICQKDQKFSNGSIGGEFDKNFELYKEKLVKPFYKDYFASLNRQIILIDALPAIFTGTEAIEDITDALTEILRSFKPGRNSWLSKILGKHKIEKILIAATKADHVTISRHKNLADITKNMVNDALVNAHNLGVQIETMAIASIKCAYTPKKEDLPKNLQHEEDLGLLKATPLKGEIYKNVTFDGEQEIYIRPPKNPKSTDVLDNTEFPTSEILYSFKNNFQPIKFRPPKEFGQNSKETIKIPHIRLGKAIKFLIGDCLS